MNEQIKIERPAGALAAAWRAKRLWLLHVTGNGLLLGAGYAWLWIPDARIWQLVVSVMLGVLTVAAALWLHGGTLVFFRAAHRGEESRLWPAFRAALPRVPALAVWLALFLLLLWLIGLAGENVYDWAAWSASWLTLHLRKPVRPDKIGIVLSWVAWTLRWILAPLLLLPLALQVSTNGFAGFARRGLLGVWVMLKSFWLWLGYALLFTVGAYLPDKLVSWHPQVSSLKLEFVSVSARFLFAYLLAVTAWIVLLSLLARWSAGGDGPAAAREPVPVAAGIDPSAAAVAE